MARVIGQQEPCVVERVAERFREMTQALAIGALEAPKFASVVSDQGCEEPSVPEVPLSIPPVGDVRGRLEDEGAEQVRHRHLDRAAFVLDDDLLSAGEGLGAAVNGHDGTAVQARLGVPWQVVGDENVDDVAIAPETVDR
ncbi:hypothetical protein [Actinotalea fermentans]|uniref:hypothetical protein n=1 Tax=Actinotalea fermentans TaxID=43671 RepID=UPI00051F3150|nr:hypothetical protein [Actinotalea fermentans]KGM17534.1 hypothetical protein N867_01350 [Actinotalea fermentans ATCC 43279 = JCM 9966 = DSM 3133]